ncbi:hypothetical protein P4679_24670 [Priestia megaterium]|uniref:hypothetical protein n=1 Tax=Priestia megaterium TaxID=1404 RepID=UPI002E1EBABE|nr:hypothetical protein [Priestia megaterium]
MPKKNLPGVDNTGAVEKVDYNDYENSDSNNDPTRNRSVEEDRRDMNPSETMGNILLDFAGGGSYYEDLTYSDGDSSIK